MAVHIAITYADNREAFFAVPEDQGWKINTAMRCLVIGKGVPRTYVPLDRVAWFEIELCGVEQDRGEQ